METEAGAGGRKRQGLKAIKSDDSDMKFQLLWDQKAVCRLQAAHGGEASGRCCSFKASLPHDNNSGPDSFFQLHH